MFAMPDIAFLLLIFLILTVTVAENEDIDIPTFQFIQETDFPDIVTVRLDREGVVEIEGEHFSASELVERLKLVESGNVVHLMADGDVEYLSVDVVLGALKEAGLVDVILIAEPDDNP